MGQEIERKFLVKDDSYKLEAYAHSHIVQGYICSARGRTVRVRIRDNKGYLTIKGASNDSGTSRYEWEKEISLQEAEELMKLCEPGVIDKIRYLVKSGEHIFEVDEFYGENEGLTVAEVELNSEDELFKKPHFIEKEVTGDIRYYNSFLMKWGIFVYLLVEIPVQHINNNVWFLHSSFTFKSTGKKTRFGLDNIVSITFQ